jgi:antitoxin component YwqK of YwqJK toxin-antitoxin module
MSLEKCVDYCKRYSDDVVYKSCGNCIVVLRKLPYTQTNEDRKNVADPNYAKFRADILEVLRIFLKYDPTAEYRSIENTCFESKQITYNIGKYVEVDNYDTCKNHVCAPGIHYFKNVIPAFYYGIKFYTGKYIAWHDNGAKMIECEYIFGDRHGKNIEWYDDGNMRTQCEYINGKLNGKYTEWYSNGNMLKECEYINGELNGKYTDWYRNGNMITQCVYINGKLNGTVTTWRNDGVKWGEDNYLNGKKHGEQIVWNYGEITSKCEYVNDRLILADGQRLFI